MGQVHKTVSILKPLIAADPQFEHIRVSWATPGWVVVAGEVRSGSELAALKALVARTIIPRQPIFSIQITSENSLTLQN
jgi:hypothetical protein